MKYTKEQKLAWVQAYKERRLCDSMVPAGASRLSFMGMVRRWARVVELLGPDAVDSGGKWRKFDAGLKLGAVARVCAGESASAVASSLGMAGPSRVVQWMKAYRKGGPEGLESKPKGRKPRMAKRKKRPARDEELEYLRAENAYLKKYLELLNQGKTASASSEPKRKPSRSSGGKASR